MGHLQTHAPQQCASTGGQKRSLLIWRFSPSLALDSLEETLRGRNPCENWFAVRFAGEPGLLPIERESLNPLLLVAMPLRQAGMYDASARPDQTDYAVVFVSDPDRTDHFTVESLQRAFDLTYREAQTAIAIARGQG